MRNFLNNFLTKAEWKWLTLTFVLTRTAVIGAGMAFSFIFPNNINDEIYLRIDVVNKSDIINVQRSWNKFDSTWLMSLTLNGYPQREFDTSQQETWGFMPLYPLTVRYASPLFLGNEYYTGLILSNIYSYLGIIFLYKLLKEKFQKAKKIIFTLLLSSGTFYLSIFYTDSLFFLLTVLTFYASHKKIYWLAFLCAGLGMVTRLHGLLLYIIPGIKILRTQKLGILKYIPIGIISALPLLGLMYYLKETTGEPLAFMKIQEAWGTAQFIPFQGFLGFLGEGKSSIINILFWFSYFNIYAKSWRKHPVEYHIYSFFYLMLSTSNDVIFGATRYMLALIPLLVGIGYLSKKERQYFIALNLFFLGVFIAAFVSGLQTAFI